MASLVAAILTLAKALPAVASLVSALSEAYAASVRNSNNADEADKNDRNADAIARARGDAVGLCDGCPLRAANAGTGQHGPAAGASSVQGGGGGGA